MKLGWCGVFSISSGVGLTAGIAAMAADSGGAFSFKKVLVGGDAAPLTSLLLGLGIAGLGTLIFLAAAKICCCPDQSAVSAEADKSRPLAAQTGDQPAASSAANPQRFTGVNRGRHVDDMHLLEEGRSARRQGKQAAQGSRTPGAHRGMRPSRFQAGQRG